MPGLLDQIEDRMRKVLDDREHPCAKTGHMWLVTGKPGHDRYCQRCGLRSYDALT